MAAPVRNLEAFARLHREALNRAVILNFKPRLSNTQHILKVIKKGIARKAAAA